MEEFNLNPISSDKPAKLSLEQQFSIKAFEAKVDEMSEGQAKQMLKQAYENMIIREVTYQHLLKHQWGLDKFDNE